MLISHLILVFIGGGLGSLGRFLFGELCQRLLPMTFPWGTFGVNLIGCLLMGIVMTGMDKTTMDPSHRVLIVTGFLGGFTTFSAFGGDAWVLIRQGEMGLAGTYVTLTVACGMGAVWVGMALMRWILHP